MAEDVLLAAPKGKDWYIFGHETLAGMQDLAWGDLKCSPIGCGEESITLLTMDA